MVINNTEFQLKLDIHMKNSSQTDNRSNLRKLRITRTVTKVKPAIKSNDNPLQTLPTWTWIFR